MDSKGFNLSVVALFACLILSFSSSILAHRTLWPPIKGCDASVLLDRPNSEKEGIPNKNSLRGFEVVDDEKAQLEAACLGTISCADILAFAARNSSYKVGKIYYDVQAGRRDERVS
ncbi:hypothetical protein K7X08_003226 [Anisodus acutangulus]|uniref:peroxidase n=1 Tax=Anisodus acutangulus TaxID=402998 RepID=A0A9Q1MGC8_9SOLA|nr:hypothetical protein K7X08_003226 [Anisodus acutangulus]